VRLFILLNWYPPDLRVPARRWGALVAQMESLGVGCTVVSAGEGIYSDHIAPAGERLIRLPISNRDQDFGEAKFSYIDHVRKRAKRRGASIIPMFLRNNAHKSWLAAIDGCEAVKESLRQCDLIIASYGPMAPLKAGYQLASDYDKPLAIDLRDSFAAKDSNDVFLSRLISRYLEKKLLSEATLRISVGCNLCRYLEDAYGLPFEPIYNGWIDGDVVLPSKIARSQSAYFYYAGTIYPHRLAALSVVLDALRKVQHSVVKIRLLRDSTERGIEHLIAEKGMAERVELLPPAPAYVVAEEMAGSAGILLLENIIPSKLHDCTVTGKLFGLLASGMPGIAVSSETGEIRAIVQKVDGWYGVSAVDDCTEALRALSAQIVNTERGSSLAIHEYHAATQAKKLQSLLTQSVESY